MLRYFLKCLKVNQLRVYLNSFASLFARRSVASRWNFVEPVGSSTYIATGGHAYFSNSYYLPQIPPTWRGALATHGVSCAASIPFGNLKTP